MAPVLKNLVLGTAKGYKVHHLRLFVESFRKFNQQDDVYLIITELDEEVLHFLEKHQIETILSSVTGVGLCLGVTRFFIYKDFLLKDETFKNYRKILLTDVSDVIFQGDPFDDTPESFLYFGGEDHNSTFSKNLANGFWIRECFGEDLLREIQDEKIVCAGTTIGSTERIKQYLTIMTDILCELLEKNPSLHAHYIDQGVHNYISYMKLIEHDVKSVGDHIANIGETILLNPLAIFATPGNLQVYGNLPKLVHQYNRSHQITHFYEHLYK